MNRLSSLLIVVLLLIAAADARPNKKKKMQMQKDIHACTFNFLVDFNLMDAEKLKVDDDVNCIDFVREKLDAYYAEMKTNYEEDGEFEEQSDCIIEKLKIFKAGVTFLQKEIYTKDKTLSKLKRNHLVTELRGALYTKYHKAQELCAPEHVFGAEFDQQYGDVPDTNANEIETDTETEEEELDLIQYQEDYCQKKHLVDSKFIDTNVFNITLNPKNIETDNFDCKKIWYDSEFEYLIGLKDEFVGAFNSPSTTETRCIFNTIKASKYMEYMLKTWALSEIKDVISEAQRKAERTAYINYNKDLFVEIMKCKEE